MTATDRHYRFRVNGKACFACGVCMDLCPYDSLDMSRLTRPGPEGGPPKSWMMALPYQAAACTGCRICEAECPTAAITIEVVPAEPPYRSRGVRFPEPLHGEYWAPLEAYTRASRRHGPPRDPWPAGALVWNTLARIAGTPVEEVRE